jgi:hypothetical protein
VNSEAALLLALLLCGAPLVALLTAVVVTSWRHHG